MKIVFLQVFIICAIIPLLKGGFMKLLVSDYDGTIFDIENLRDTRKNVDAIKRFKDNGNLFAIATARTFSSIKTQTDKFKIPYDYLICSDGGCVFDKDDNLIYSNAIDENFIIRIHNYLENLPFIKKFNFLDSFGKNTNKLCDVHQIYIEVYIKNTLEILKIKKALAPLIGVGFLSICYFYKHTLKTDGIKIVSDIENLDKKDIYTIGNGNNDICMLREYNGFRVPYSYPKVMLQGFPKNSVYSLVRKIESDNI